jgi:hypothetical protein
MERKKHGQGVCLRQTSLGKTAFVQAYRVPPAREIEEGLTLLIDTPCPWPLAKNARARRATMDLIPSLTIIAHVGERNWRGKYDINCKMNNVKERRSPKQVAQTQRTIHTVTVAKNYVNKYRAI